MAQSPTTLLLIGSDTIMRWYASISRGPLENRRPHHRGSIPGAVSLPNELNRQVDIKKEIERSRQLGELPAVDARTRDEYAWEFDHSNDEAEAEEDEDEEDDEGDDVVKDTTQVWKDAPIVPFNLIHMYAYLT